MGARVLGAAGRPGRLIHLSFHSRSQLQVQVLCCDLACLLMENAWGACSLNEQSSIARNHHTIRVNQMSNHLSPLQFCCPQEVLISSASAPDIQFVAKRWLATDEGDGQTYCTLYPSDGKMPVIHKYRIHVSLWAVDVRFVCRCRNGVGNDLGDFMATARMACIACQVWRPFDGKRLSYDCRFYGNHMCPLQSMCLINAEQ